MTRPAHYAMIAPAALLVLMLWVVPLAGVAVVSLQASSLLEWTWTGLRNYAKLIRDPKWGMAVVNSLVYSSIAIVVGILGGALIALPTASLSKGTRSLVRIGFYLPSLSAGILISQMWLLVFSTGGLANVVVTRLGLPEIHWLSNRWTAIAVIGMTVQLSMIGATVVVFSTMLEGVPVELHEAARLDGASALQVWRYVDIPWISKTVVLVGFGALSGGFTIWETPYVLTRGGPDGATASALYAAWSSAFISHKYGMAAAQSLALLVIVLGIAFGARTIKHWMTRGEAR